ncbi:MAG: FAD-binding oxidoreductase, partial [Phycisphaerales bacterium]|nr:FAD-binding oxidoreductase [Phycisphaerales bacterium]
VRESPDPMSRFVLQQLAGWGNYRPEPCRVYRPERRSEVRELLTHGAADDAAATTPARGAAGPAAADRPDLIARGLGRSYGDSATNAGGGVLLQTRMDCLIGFDPATGLLEAEAGVSFATLVDLFLPRGFFLPVTPGTKFVTLGGAIAADVHGKNHHVDGTIGNFVVSLRLLTAGGEVLACSPTENADVFWATVGGMGLTGVILSATIRMIPVSSAYAAVDYRKAANLDDALEKFADPTHAARKYSVAWIDCLAAGGSLGRCVIMDGEHLPAADLPAKMRADPLALPRKRGKPVPVNFPGFALNRLSVKLFNKAYYWKQPQGRRVVDLDAYFYPLDGVRDWNRIYGKRGFVQYQALFPPATARQGLKELLERLSASGGASFLAVLKRTGGQGPGMLSYPFAGYTLALDLPNTGRRLAELVRSLDETLLKHGGRLYLAKDSMMSAEAFAAMYPRLGEFRAVKARVDPGNRFSSTQARRLRIAE